MSTMFLKIYYFWLDMHSLRSLARYLFIVKRRVKLYVLETMKIPMET